MIARIRGRPLSWDAEGLVLDVGGVGYRLHATPSAVRKAEGAAEVALETHLHVREDALQLYGFASAGERELFEHLLSVSGVGPKVALAIVSGYSPAELRGAIAREDTDLFATIPGIGRKTAQRVVLELKEKIGDPLGSDARARTAREEEGDGHVVAREALVELGYSPTEAEQRLAAIDADLPPAERVREALRAA
jgi:holliday junction DNA helicase RuvA